jgi:hypothetical protein
MFYQSFLKIITISMDLLAQERLILQAM